MSLSGKQQSPGPRSNSAVTNNGGLIIEDTIEGIVLAAIVVTIGLIGSVANIITVFLIGKAKVSHAVKSINTLILNQLAIDLYSCLFLVITYGFRLSGYVYPSNPSENDVFFCMVIDSELLLSVGLDGSAASIVFIAFERFDI